MTEDENELKYFKSILGNDDNQESAEPPTKAIDRNQDSTEPTKDCCCSERYEEFRKKSLDRLRHGPYDPSWSTEFPTFVPIGDELIALVKYYETASIEDSYFVFRTAYSISHDLKLQRMANFRIAAIEKIIGREKVQHAIEEAWYEFAKNEDPVLWHVFMYGTEEDQEKVLDHTHLQMKYADCCRPSEKLACKDNSGKGGRGAE